MDEYQNFTVMNTKWRFRPLLLPQLKINFNFHMKIRTTDVVDLDPTAGPIITPGPSTPYHASATVRFADESLSCDDSVRETFATAISGSIMDGDEEMLTEIVSEELSNHFRDKPIPRSGIFYVDLNIKVDRFTVTTHDVGDDYEYVCMVPAADSSAELLEKCEVDCVASCPICMEDALGGAATRLPCSHVFHDCCIREWLKTSHYCPICRYELPTQ